MSMYRVQKLLYRFNTFTPLECSPLFITRFNVTNNKSSRFDFVSSKYVHRSSQCNTFWERNKKSGYLTKLPMQRKVKIVEALGELNNEVRMWMNEIKEKLASDPILVYRTGEVDVAFDFSSQNSINNWVVTTDSDHNEGKSTATLQITGKGTGIFEGFVSSDYMRDGCIKNSGYANMRSLRVRKSFKREATYDWTQYNTLVLKVRGDGRNYLINLHTEGYFDLMWNDIYHYVLFTRGGPHWQTAKIPFSKFFLSSKGRVQDKQGSIRLDRVTHFGFSVGAKNGSEGQFSLEIDYVGLEFDSSQNEEFAYEMYRTDNYIAAT